MLMKNKNYLEFIPVIKQKNWTKDSDGITVKVKNRGFFRKILNRPQFTFVHLDTVGSFIWERIDGETKISDFAKPLKEQFGDSISPVYQRLAKYFDILKSNGFIYYDFKKIL